MKRCSACGAWKPLDEFHRKRNAKDGRQPRCRPCNIELNKQWYRDNPRSRSRLDEYAKRYRRSNHVRILDHLRTHPCVDCGESGPVVLEFDHLRDKRRNISAMHGHAWREIAEEIRKCEVVCANCHRRRTAARSGFLGWNDARKA